LKGNMDGKLPLIDHTHNSSRGIITKLEVGKTHYRVVKGLIKIRLSSKLKMH